MIKQRRTLLCLFLLAIAFGVLATAQPTSANSYGGWVPFNAPHANVEFRVRCDCDGGPVNGKYMWWVQFWNRSNEKVAFDFRITRAGERPTSFSDRMAIQAGGMQEDWNSVDQVPSAGVDVWAENWQTGPNAQ